MSKPSLVSQGKPGTSLAMPAEFDSPIAVVPPTVSRVPFVIFATPKSSLWGKVTAACPGVQDGDPVLMRPEPATPLRLVPFRFNLVNANQYWAVTADDGTLVKTFQEKPDVPGKIDEYIETVLLVYTADGIVCARCTWKNTKLPAIHLAAKALSLAATDEWAKQGPDYAASVRAPKPFMRFTCSATPVVRTARTSGRRYVTTAGQIVPISTGDLEKLSAYFGDVESKPRMAQVAEHYARRLDEVKSKLSK